MAEYRYFIDKSGSIYRQDKDTFAYPMAGTFELYSTIDKNAEKKWHWQIPYNYDDRGWKPISEEEVEKLIK